MRRRAATRLASFAFCGALTACVPPAPLTVGGALPPPSTTYVIVGDEGFAQAARQPLMDALANRGLRYATDRPDRFVDITLADRPRANGTIIGNNVPASHDAPGWLDRPVKSDWFSKGRREVRLTIRFLSADGKVCEERTASEVLTRKAPDPNIARLIDVALRH